MNQVIRTVKLSLALGILVLGAGCRDTGDGAAAPTLEGAFDLVAGKYQQNRQLPEPGPWLNTALAKSVEPMAVHPDWSYSWDWEEPGKSVRMKVRVPSGKEFIQIFHLDDKSPVQ